MFIAKYYYKSTERTGTKADSNWVSRKIAEHPSSSGECIRLAAYFLQHEDFDTWEDKITRVLFGPEEYIADCERKLQEGTWKVFRGRLIRIKES